MTEPYITLIDNFETQEHTTEVPRDVHDEVEERDTSEMETEEFI